MERNGFTFRHRAEVASLDQKRFGTTFVVVRFPQKETTLERQKTRRARRVCWRHHDSQTTGQADAHSAGNGSR